MTSETVDRFVGEGAQPDRVLAGQGVPYGQHHAHPSWYGGSTRSTPGAPRAVGELLARPHRLTCLLTPRIRAGASAGLV
ncbi:hypothetical protein ACPCAG_17510 [Streptomyces pseudogriseolus]|uniref:hypothetical protein n=1 Tax=Streptomyces pseudogriseolus TaxID=36817 RepID=UPI003FA208B0